MQKNLLRVFFFFLLISFQKVHSQQLTAYDLLVTANPLWTTRTDVDPVLKTKPAEPLNEKQLMQFHLQEVEKLFRNRSTETFSVTAKKNRATNLNTLHKYWQNGIFPINSLHSNRLPYFIDDNNRYCAVGYLMKNSGADSIARDIQKRQNYSYLADITHPKLMDWVANCGLSFDELSLIQPVDGYVLPTSIIEMHYNNTGDDVDEYIEVVRTSNPLEQFRVLTELRFYDHSGILYKTILLTQMQQIPGTNAYYYSFPSNEDFADSGKVELAGTIWPSTIPQVFSDLTYNSSGITLQDYGFNYTQNFIQTENEETHPWNSITFCGMYMSTWSANVLPISIATLNPCTPTFVPIILTSFTTDVNDKSVHLKWQVDKQPNVDHYEIERSTDAKNFISIGKVNATGVSTNDYSFDDNSPNYVNHYRLKIYDKDGSFAYSRILYVKKSSANLLALKQNPVTNQLHISVNTDLAKIDNITIYDFFGRTILRLKAVAGNQSINTAGFGKGKYLIRLYTKDGQVYTQQFMK